MSMFGEIIPFSDNFQEGDYFTLLDARIGNELSTVHGDGTPVQLKIATEDKPTGEWYSAFGQALVNQVSRMEPGELAGGVECCITRQANKKGTLEYKVLATRAQVEADAVPAA